jgi:hypothetical protein
MMHTRDNDLTLSTQSGTKIFEQLAATALFGHYRVAGNSSHS